MEKMKLSKETMQKLEEVKNSLHCGNVSSTQYGTPTAGCGTCWGGGCANGITG